MGDDGCGLVTMNVRSCIRWVRQRWPWILVIVSLIGLAAWWGPQVWRIARDEAALQAAIAELGWLGPLALILINVLQIVIAPIPGYVMQAAAGYLYGPFWGGIWGSIGLLAGAMLAMGLARTFGRPLVERFVGIERLEHWENATYSTSTCSLVHFIGGAYGRSAILSGWAGTRFLLEDLHADTACTRALYICCGRGRRRHVERDRLAAGRGYNCIGCTAGSVLHLSPTPRGAA